MSPSIWILDSRASHHMSYGDKSFAYLNHASSMSVMCDDDIHIPLAHIGFISVTNISFLDVYYISKHTLSHAYVMQLYAFVYSITFVFTSCCVKDSYSGRLIETCRREGGFTFWMS